MGANMPGKEEDLFCVIVTHQSHSDNWENVSCFFLNVSSHKDLDTDLATQTQAKGF